MKYLLVALIITGGLLLQSETPISIYPPDAVADSLIRDWYENGWFADRWDVNYVKHIVITNKSVYGRYMYGETANTQWLMGVAYTVHVGYCISDQEGYDNLIWDNINCFLFYEAEGMWYIENVRMLPAIDERTDTRWPKSKKI